MNIKNKIFGNKEENKTSDSDKDKEKLSVSSIFFIIFFVIALIYVIILFIKSGFEKPEVYYSNNLEQYQTKENLVKTDYFYTIDAIVANFLEAVDKEMYSDLYNIVDDKYKKIYSKNYIVDYLKEAKEKYLIYPSDKKEFTGHVVKVYSLDDITYLVQLDLNNFNLIITQGRKGYNFTIVE